MNTFNIIIFVVSMMSVTDTDSFKTQQLHFPRVRQAYHDKGQNIDQLLKDKALTADHLWLYIRAFKHEDLLEIWARNKNDSTYILLKSYDVCNKSGGLGPKRRQGDLQVPEGFYHIDRFNPASNFYLSLGINYPNESDKILSDDVNPGGDIFIHGNCVTIGCLPMTDDVIKELYILCVEAKNNDQHKIPVTIFPCKFDNPECSGVIKADKVASEIAGLWNDLNDAFTHFKQFRTVPKIEFLPTGRHLIN